MDVLPVNPTAGSMNSLDQTAHESNATGDIHHDLEPIEAMGLSCLDFTIETLNEVLIEDAIRCSKECKDM